jgi:N-ethylmaleimide reductase
MYTDALGMQPHSLPRAMQAADIRHAIGEYAQAAHRAVEAGFDGVELHGANGYLIEQFLNPNVNRRQDGYGQDPGGRNRFAVEVAMAVAAAIGPERVGIRLSPYGVFNATGEFPEVQAQYLSLAERLSALHLQYLHLVDHSSMGAPVVPADFKLRLRAGFKGLFILSGGFTRTSAEAALVERRGDLVAFGRAMLANPDLVARMRLGAALNEPDPATFYTPGAKGYTDYPALSGSP